MTPAQRKRAEELAVKGYGLKTVLDRRFIAGYEAAVKDFSEEIERLSSTDNYEWSRGPQTTMQDYNQYYLIETLNKLLKKWES